MMKKPGQVTGKITPAVAGVYEEEITVVFLAISIYACYNGNNLEIGLTNCIFCCMIQAIKKKLGLAKDAVRSIEDDEMYRTVSEVIHEVFVCKQ